MQLFTAQWVRYKLGFGLHAIGLETQRWDYTLWVMNNTASQADVESLLETAARHGFKVETTQESWALGDDTCHVIVAKRHNPTFFHDWVQVIIRVRRPKNSRRRTRTSITVTANRGGFKKSSGIFFARHWINEIVEYRKLDAAKLSS